jgi:hypothetical protein
VQKYPLLIATLFVLNIGCEDLLKKNKCKSDCSINIYSELPINSNGIYELNWNPNLVTTYSHLYVNTECGLHTKVSWDSDTQYQLSTVDWTNLINPSSMTDEDGNGTIVFGVWEDHIGSTITFYGGYTDDCDNHFVDSVKVKILNN